jgi:hypothetical protein
VLNRTLRPLQSGGRDLLPPAEQVLPCENGVVLRGLLLQQVLLGHHAREDRRPRPHSAGCCGCCLAAGNVLPPLWGWQLQRRACAAAGACQLCPLRS